ncbi:MAG: hypothetical protein AAF617_15950 [Bacteroidota bacterium]
MKKKNLTAKLYLRKQNVAAFQVNTIKGGLAFSPPVTVEADVCEPSDICSDKATCPFVCITMREDACYTDEVLSCEPYVCGDVA